MVSMRIFKILIFSAHATNAEPRMDEKKPTNPTIVEQKLTYLIRCSTGAKANCIRNVAILMPPQAAPLTACTIGSQ